VKTTVALPDTVSLGARQRLSAQWTLLATVEWAHWSRIGTSRVLQTSGAPALVATVPVTLPFRYRNGWLYSAGIEYQLNSTTELRTGIGFERSPVTDQVRTPLVPDSDRILASLGASTKLENGLRLDFAYLHVFLNKSRVDISAASGNPWFNPLSPIAYVGRVSSHHDVLSVGLSYRFS
jgi:long-chain fatty acid transport protein